MPGALPIDVLLTRCERRVRREYAKAALGRPLPRMWAHRYETAISDLIWDLYSLDNVLTEQDWEKAAEELSGERLQTVTPEDYFSYSRETISELRADVKTIPSSQIDDLERPIRGLTKLLKERETSESKYQQLLERYPWILGAQYESVQDHRKLDDQNVPDFTGVRVLDKHRDILEIKSPFMPILRKQRKLASEFNQAWNQAERYLSFARENKDYLRREKNLLFENPKCYLIAGNRLTSEARKQIRIKQTMNPAIEFLSYDDLKVLAQETVRWIRDLKTGPGRRAGYTRNHPSRLSRSGRPKNSPR